MVLATSLQKLASAAESTPARSAIPPVIVAATLPPVRSLFLSTVVTSVPVRLSEAFSGSLPRPGSAVAFCVAGSAIFVSAPEVSSPLREREVGRAAWALWDARALRAGVADSDFALDERRERRVDDALVGVLTVTIA